jgi:periplasmic copper chaperone A
MRPVAFVRVRKHLPNHPGVIRTMIPSLSARPAGARRVATVLVAAVATLAIAAPAFGHISIPEQEVATGSTSVVHLRVPHGCDGASTDTIEVQLPDGVVGAQPAYVPGWTVETEMVASEPYERFGETLTERVGVIRWSGGDLPDAAFYDFGIRATFLVDDGMTLALPVLQRCGVAEIAWIEPVVEGEAEPEHPAPTLTIGEAVEEEAHH